MLTATSDDPPFYMSNRAPYVPGNFVASTSDRRFGDGPFSRLDSENEDLRGVIDDLTVENKRLKQMIRVKQRPSHLSPSDATQAQDKLFEVRMHGLPAEKRRELEFLLKNFASSVHTSVPSKATSSSNVSGSRASGGPNATIRTHPTTDSGYASNSSPGGGFLPTQEVLHKSSNTKNVQSYLKDIPDTLLPKQNPILSERAKQALVVRRLEQLFTGRSAAPGAHDQPNQQQEISNSAARADRLQDARDNKKRKAEGMREARVFPPDTRVNLDAPSPTYPPNPKKKDATTDLISRPGSPEQRPTRPLDLDIHRAQIAADNIAYLTHLGFSAPKLEGPGREGEGTWMYLNLLSGLAQLHTLNVTPDQIRKAIKKLSKHLEVSKDGGKVRWIGGAEATKFATEDERAIEVADISIHDSSEDLVSGGASSKRSKTDTTSNAAGASNTTSDDKMSGLQTSNGSKNPQLTSATSNLQGSSVPTKETSATKISSAFDYKPIVLRQKLGNDLDDEMRDSDESYDSPSIGSSGLAHALSQSNLNQVNKGEGMITFFNNPFFCSDFSWEREPSNMLPPRETVVGETLGVPVPIGMIESPLRHHDATYFTTQFAPKPFDPEMLPNSEREKFEQSLPVFVGLQPIRDAGEAETVPLDFEVCGLGGIVPDDNFLLDVKTERQVAPANGLDAIVKTMPFSRRRYLQKFETNVTSCQKIDLLPSKLPPPSYIFFTSSSSSDNNELDDDSDEDDATSDTSSSPMVDEQYPAPPDFLQQFSGSSGEHTGDDEDDDKASSEIDMLAIARKEYPKEVAEQERVYMLNQPGGGQRAVAGSLAATVGDSASSASVRHIPAPGSVDSQLGSMNAESDEDDEDDEDMSDA